MTGFAIRPARPNEATALSDLCLRSKAHWGYDAAFMEASRQSLTLTPETIARGCVLVAEDAGGRIAGVTSSARLDANGTFDLVHMFVEPVAIGTGAGRALFEAIVERVRAEGGTRLMILADPNAEAFYRRLGAKRVGDAPSDAIPGRMLPLLEYMIR